MICSNSLIIIATGDEESIELTSSDIPDSEATTNHLDSIDEHREVTTTSTELDSVDEHRENVSTANTNHHRTSMTVVTVDPDNEDELPEGVDGVIGAQQEAAAPEKLQDEDQFAEIWYKRWFFAVFPQLRRGECVERYASSSPGSIFKLCIACHHRARKGYRDVLNIVVVFLLYSRRAQDIKS